MCPCCEVALCLTGGGKGKGTDVGRDHTSLGAKIWLTRHPAPLVDRSSAPSIPCGYRCLCSVTAAHSVRRGMARPRPVAVSIPQLLPAVTSGNASEECTYTTKHGTAAGQPQYAVDQPFVGSLSLSRTTRSCPSLARTHGHCEELLGHFIGPRCSAWRSFAQRA
jgi:hypothetical protein